ncbi:enoyl-CoA hydratase/isomerase family protein [Mycobacterium sp. pW049]|uniref:enoyl-CoA hydratase/isomerase family protein n=1 Tax=[Mycobacterium] bulgaricum TaxID=3238985 RepID=UPI00351BAE1E
MTDGAPPLTVDGEGPVAIITLNRPGQHNAADSTLHRRLAEVWSEVGADRSIRAVVLTGAGESFSAGGDFALMKATSGDPDVADVVFAEARATVLGMIELPQPIVAAVNGPAVGLGASLAALSDVTVAAETAFLADPHLAVGLVPGDGAAMLWPLLIGLSRAKHLVFLGERITAAEALEIGLVNRVVPAGKAVEVALEVAQQLARVPHRALQDTKRLMNQHAVRALRDGLDQAISAERHSVVSPEHAERVDKMIARAGAKG